MKPVRILVTGGGTGGHVSPALAVVQTLRKWAETPGAVFSPEFLYLGSETGIESKLAREADIPFRSVATGKLRRSSKGILGLVTAANLRDALRVPVGIGESFTAVRAFKPDVVLATGGYVSVPPVIAAGFSGVPVLIHEQTVTVGLANKIAGRFAKRIALSFAESIEELPPPLRKKAVVTGNPVRSIIFGGNRANAASRYGFVIADDALPCVYVTGGAQGSRIINRAILEVLAELLAFCRIVHQCGKQPEGTEQDFDRLAADRAALPDEMKQRYHVTPFVETSEIGDLFALADLIVGRSGAGTVTEVCALGKPAIFVPLQPASGDEQMRNAQRLVKIGAARVIRQEDCNGMIFLQALRQLLGEPEQLRIMGESSQTLATPGATRDLASELLRLVDASFVPPEDHPPD
ncbi:MAG: UDP-N-acetylglucosamine--N-acetylmuramyl-(pentapeptide) pyrophosphoryl-undecaprenol N-acetylglucosamine transferase [Akkermansiaceae bacterium]|nr:UDP-N-acetylglucosamine--N-acetylmuramyl-(pentapeptide) pyrophosphoryl-undecaprenol N-acetylglucosamine transferase [Armatimonadota bacterium]